jgi:hypothetical protein
MTTEAFWQTVQAELAAARITDPVFRCMLLAMAEQESIGRKGPTRLAVEHFNLFGFKGIKGLKTVRFGANEFETASQVYASFPSYAKCFQSVLYAVFKSRHYARARARACFAFSEAVDRAMPVRECRRAWCAAWIVTAGPVWAPPNPTHGKEVLWKFERWLDLEWLRFVDDGGTIPL